MRGRQTNVRLIGVMAAALLAGLSGCMETPDGEAGGDGAETPARTTIPTGGVDDYPPAEGMPCDLKWQSLTVMVEDTRNGSYLHRVDLHFNEVTISIETTVGRETGHVLKGYGAFRVDYLEAVDADWLIDSVADKADFQPVCHPRFGYVTFQMSDEGREVDADYGTI